MSDIICVDGLIKEYAGIKVVDGVSFSVNKGEIYGLLGRNGAGKTTIMKILLGLANPTSGKVSILGKDMSVNSEKKVLKKVGCIIENPGFYSNLTGTENLEIFAKLRGLDQDSVKKALELVNLPYKDKKLFSKYSLGMKQRLAIANAIMHNPEILVLDEPIAVLTEDEAEILLETMKKLSAKGIAIIFITHRLNEIMAVSDKVTVLRDGQLINTVATKSTNVNEITEWMIGRKVNSSSDAKKAAHDDLETLLEIRNLWVDMPGEMLKGLDLDIKKGEILGLGGMAGQGKIAVANGIMGLFKSKGDIKYKNETLVLNKPTYPLEKGIFFVSEDRKGVGLLLDESIERNIAFPAMQIKKQFFKKFLGLFNVIDDKAVTENAKKYIEKLEIKSMGEKQKVGELSGGNQQKVCVAKAFTMEPDLLFVSEPTRGIDVGAKQLVLETLKEYNRERNTTIVVTSSEIEELRSICDRIAIVNEGKVAGILPASAGILEFGKLMSGIKEGE